MVPKAEESIEKATLMRGCLNRDKDAMLQKVRRVRIRLSPVLNWRPIRRGEGAIVMNPAYL